MRCTSSAAALNEPHRNVVVNRPRVKRQSASAGSADSSAAGTIADGMARLCHDQPVPTSIPQPKAISSARTTLSRIMTALDVNLLGTVHGGVIMKLVDDV